MKILWVCLLDGSLSLRIRDEHLNEEPCLGIVLEHEVARFAASSSLGLNRSYVKGAVVPRFALMPAAVV